MGLLNKVIVYNFDTENGLENPIHTIEGPKVSTNINKRGLIAVKVDENEDLTVVFPDYREETRN